MSDICCAIDLMRTYWYATMALFSLIATSLLCGICSATKYSDEMKGAAAPANLKIWHSATVFFQNIQEESYSEIGSKMVITNRGNGGSIDVIFA